MVKGAFDSSLNGSTAYGLHSSSYHQSPSSSGYSAYSSSASSHHHHLSSHGGGAGHHHEKRVGIYTIEERRMKIDKFRERKRQRIWRKQIKYDCRKRLADTRPRWVSSSCFLSVIIAICLSPSLRLAALLE
jgi:hypothetical protein